jgi:hypothetical protein
LPGIAPGDNFGMGGPIEEYYIGPLSFETNIYSCSQSRQRLPRDSKTLKLSPASSSDFSIIFPTHECHSLSISSSQKMFISARPPIFGTLWVRITGGGEEGHQGVRDELAPIYTVAPRTGQSNIGDESALREARVE